MNQSVVLVGFTSTGKSHVGRLLAQMLGMPFYDLDQEVERLHSAERGNVLACRDIYKTLGRECFVAYEHQALHLLVEKRPCVLATGGGAPLEEQNRQLLCEFGTIVYIRADAEVIFERMKFKGVPVFLHQDPTVENLRRFQSQRHPIYQSMATLSLDTTALSPVQSAEQIVEALSKPEQ
jgi:shikimate kinase